MLFEGRPFFTDSAVYNSYDLGGSPLGFFDKGAPRFGARLGYRYGGLGGGSGQHWDAPELTVGNPGRSFFQVFYDPRIISSDVGGNDVSLPLHRFGLALAAQGSSGAVRGSFMAEGYYGTQVWDGNVNDDRLFMGFDKLRFDLGSQVHPLVSVGFFAGITGVWTRFWNRTRGTGRAR
jgi:hypothetical protein